MTEPQEPQEPTEPQEPVETPTEPVAPTQEPGEGDHPSEEDEAPEAPEEPQATVQPQATSEQDIEKAMDKLGREAKRHRDRIAEIMGEDALALLPCELCWPPAPGFRFPQVPEEQRAAVMLAIGFDPKPDLEADKHAHACPDCHGWGKVDTGSKVQGQDALPCLTCNGDGWMGDRRQLARSTSFVPAAAPPENGPQPPPVSDSEREAARREAEAKGYMVIDTRAPAA